MKTNHIRNIGIIAHVDHGKTTLIDRLLEQSGMFRDGTEHSSCIMDSNELERERGITIFSKNASILYKGHKLNIVDTPGHADFGGEVERILKMVNGVLLLVDAAEGPMPQTRFVLKKSLELGLKPIVVINKIDRPGANPNRAVDQVFDLFVNLNATDEQLDFPIVYTSAKLGFAKRTLDSEPGDMTPVLDLIVDKVPAHTGDAEAPFQMQVTSIDYNDYVGRIAIGKIERGRFRATAPSTLIRRNGSSEPFKLMKAYTYEGLNRVEVQEAEVGDIIGIAGMKEVDIGETIADSQHPDPLPLIRIDEPTMSIYFAVNDSPFSGKDGKFLTSGHLRERLQKEVKSNIALRVEESAAGDKFKVSGRGELHLGILIETMRREGYEFSISRPQVLLKEVEGKTHEPLEFVVIDVEETYSGKVMEAMGTRKGSLKNMLHMEDGHVRLEYHVPTRFLFGFQSDFLTMTKGTGTLQHTFEDFVPFMGGSAKRLRGALIALENGQTTGYSIFNLQDRGQLFVGPGQPVYTGMIIGENNKDNDLVVNICKEKKLTNMRASGSDDTVILTPPRVMSLEQVLGFLNEDELAEITPHNIRLRKKFLDENERKRNSKTQKVA